MLVIENHRLAEIARREEDTLGHLLMALAFPDGQLAEEEIVVRPARGWQPCDPGEVAAARYGDVPMKGYTPGGGIVVTLAEVDGVIAMHAEGAGWAIEARNAYAGWERSREPRRQTILDDEDDTREDPRAQVHVPDMGPVDMRPSWLRPGYDWDAAVAADPANTLSRLHLLARSLGIGWEGADAKGSPTQHVMIAIEKALGLETVEEIAAGHRLPMGRRIDIAEAALRERT